MAEETDGKLQKLISSVIKGLPSTESRSAGENMAESLHKTIESIDCSVEFVNGDSRHGRDQMEAEDHDLVDNVKYEVNEETGNEDETLEELLESEDEDTINDLNQSEGLGASDTEASILRVDVSQSEITMFEESFDGDDRSSLTKDGTISFEDGELDFAEEVGVEMVAPRTKLHCRMCGNIYSDPRMLGCLHTYCLKCLLGYCQTSKGHKKGKNIMCPLCKAFTPIKESPVEDLPVNVVIKQLVDISHEGTDFMNCVVCLLHGVKMESAGQCLDCGDLLCTSCCEKHTYSRQTAKHTIVSLDEQPAILKRSHTTLCPTHTVEIASFYCPKCQKLACRDCILIEHASHRVTSADEMNKKLRSQIYASIGSLDEKLAKLEDDEKYEETLALLKDKEDEELEILKNGKKKMIDIIERDFAKHVKMLSDLFGRRRKVCESRHAHMVYRRIDVHEIKETVDFFFAEGKITEIIQMEKTVKDRIKSIDKNINSTKQKINVSKLPKAIVSDENIKKLSGFHLFSVKSLGIEDENSLSGKSSASGTNKLENTQVKSKQTPTRSQQTKSCLNAQQSLSSMSSDFTERKFSFGRGMPLASSRSLLGEYPGPGGAVKMSSSVLEPIMCMPVGWHGNQKDGDTFPVFQKRPGQENTGLLMEDQRIVRMRGDSSLVSQPVTLRLRASVKVQVSSDKKQPNITDAVFTSPENFVVCDTRNQILKAFSFTGQYLDYISDPGPMSVTYLQNQLIWNSQYSIIKCYCLHTREVTQMKHLNTTATHPLTSFSNNNFQRFLVGNVDRSSIVAYSLEGQPVHSLEPKDKFGRVVKNITYIAAYMNDQIALVDSHLQRVVLTDFDGRCIGEFSKPGMDPSSVCITEHNQIFVTDRARNKIILLNRRAEFLKEWSTLIKAPSAMATNGKGMLVLVGEGKEAKIYEYHISQ